MLQRTRRTAALQARNRAQRALSGAEGRNGKTGGSRVRAAEYLVAGANSGLRSSSSGRASATRHPHSAQHAGQRASPALLPHNTRLGLAQCGADPHPAFEHFPKRTCVPFPEKSAASPSSGKAETAPGRCRKQATPQNRHRGGNNRRRNGQHRREQPLPQPGPRVRPCSAGGGPRFRSQKRNTPRARRKKRRSAKPKFCRTPDRHGSGLARSLNRTFSYRMKLVRMTGSFSGSGTPAALPASKQRSIHAMFLAS